MNLKKILKILDQARNKIHKNQIKIDHKILEIAQVEKKLQEFMHKSKFNKLCCTCEQVCCAEFLAKIIFIQPETIYFVAKQNPELNNICKKETFRTGKCPLLTNSGCILHPHGRPRICISYFCQFPYKKNAIPLVNSLCNKFHDLQKLLNIKD